MNVVEKMAVIRIFCARESVVLQTSWRGAKMRMASLITSAARSVVSTGILEKFTS